MADVPSRVVELIETFDRNIEAYRSQQYNEDQVRREFIDPFFEELGWDITNKAGHAQAYKDVIHDDSFKISVDAEVPAEKTRIQRQINTTDKKIDKPLYSLYGLTVEEIAIVEIQGK
jgi:hypothetical protein